MQSYENIKENIFDLELSQQMSIYVISCKKNILTSVTKNLSHICYSIQLQICDKFFVTDVIVSWLIVFEGHQRAL